MKNKIGRYLLKNYLSFENVDLNFNIDDTENNLILFYLTNYENHLFLSKFA